MRPWTSSSRTPDGSEPAQETLRGLGEHYVTDAALGAAYATGAYVLVDRAWPALARRRQRAAGAVVRATTPGGAG